MVAVSCESNLTTQFPLWFHYQRTQCIPTPQTGIGKQRGNENNQEKNSKKKSKVHISFRPHKKYSYGSYGSLFVPPSVKGY